jgi:uncharacterized DUF497 family protein
MEFEWDPEKAAANTGRRGISFAEAASASRIRCPPPSQTRATPMRRLAS